VRDVDLSHGTGITYRHFAGDVLWPFGSGGSYSTFSYKWSDCRGPGCQPESVLSTSALLKTSADHQVVVTNTGAVAGDAVALLFAASANHRGTNKDVHGAPLRKVHITIPAQQHAYIP